MLNLISILVGIIAFPVMLIGLIPILGMLNYVAIALALIGLAFGALSDRRSGRNLNLLVLIVAVVRLILGHGIL